ncbi:MAG: TonB family protein [Neolewinella sp.]|jgi:TonB family protein
MSRYHLYLLSFSCLLSLCPVLLLGQPADSVVPPPPLPEVGMFVTWERMPTLHRCDSLGHHSEQLPCSEQTIRRILADNLRWPAESCAEGMVVVSFYVEADGRLHDFKVVRSLIPAFDAEALRVVKLMAAQTEPWHPGTWARERKPMRVQYNLPVKFRLE